MMTVEYHLRTISLSNFLSTLKSLEATLSDSKKKYSDKVSALLSAWEYVTNYIPAAPPEAIQSVIEWAHRHTLTFVLRGEWPKLAPNVAKTHLCVTLQRCVSQLGQQHPAASRCSTLLALVNNPWTNPILTNILNGQSDSEHEEEFCCSEPSELLTMRLKMLCEDRCEDIAVNLAAACVRSLRRSDRLRSLSESHHVHYMIDVYIVLLFKLKRTQDIFAQLKLMDLNDGLELVQRLNGEKPTKYGTTRIWRNSIKAAELVAQYLVTVGMIRPISEIGANIFEQILNSWALSYVKLGTKDVAPTLPDIIRKFIQPAESAQHIYIFCAVLAKHFGENIKPLVIELYIRALTTDMNELESQKAKSDKDKERETAKRLSTQFLKLADVVDSNIGIAKECVLTAFSLHPTRACYDRIKELAVACGKAKEDDVSQEGEIVKREEPNKIQEKNPREDDLPTSSINVKSEIMDNNSITETLSAQSSSLIVSEMQLYQNSTIAKNIDFQNEQVTETFEQTDQLLKSLLTKKPEKMTDTTMPVTLINNRCPLHLKQESSSNELLGEVCFNCGEFTGNNKPNDGKSQMSETSTMPSNNSMERTLDTLNLIKSETVIGSVNYDEKSVPSQVLDGEKLGLSPQLCDDLAVVLNSPRFNLLSWVLDWTELKNSCEQYLENEEMRNTNKELKYLNIDYSQFKDWPSEDDTKDIFFGIEKGYEQWADLPSDNSEQFGSFQPAAGYKRSSTRRSLDDTTTTDSDSGSVLRVRRTARTRKIHRLESSESDYDSAEPKPKRFRDRISSVSDSDSNTQDSQTDSLGSDGCRLEIKKKSNKSSNKESNKKRSKTSKLTVESVSHFHMLVNEDARRTNAHEDASGSDVSSNDIITLFSADMDENKRETIKGSAYTAAAQLIITTERRSDPAVLKSLRMYRPQNSKKKPSRISQILQKNLLNKSKDTNNANRDCTEQQGTNNITKFAPMLSTLNLNPKIVLTRTDEIDRKLTNRSKKQQQRLSSGDITSELINIKTTMPFSPNSKSVMTYQKKQKEHVSGKNNTSGKNDLDCPVIVDGHRDHHHHHRLGSVKSLGKTKYDFFAVRDSDILTKNVPGMNSLDMMVPPRQRSTVNVVQLSRSGVPQSPSSATSTTATINVSGNTPPRPTRTPSVASNQSSSGGNNSIQLPGTPSSTGGHDSGVGMSPAGQTPPLRSSSNLGTPPDTVGEEANQLPDAASPTTISPTIPTTTMTANNPSTIHQLDVATAAVIESSGTVRTMAQIRRASNQHNQSPRKSPSSPCSTGSIAIITTTMTTTTTATSPGGLSATPITSEPLKVICKPDGSYHITSLNPNQRNLLGLQNLDEGISFARQTTQQQQQQRVTDATGGASSNRNAYDRLAASSVKNTSQSGQNAVLPKFNQAFRKTLYTMSTDTPASGVTTAPNDTPLSNIQQTTAGVSTQKTTTNLSKAVQTSVPNNQQQPQHQQQQQQTNAGSINVQSIIPNLQLSANRQVVSIVPSSGNNGPANAAISSNQAANQTITQLVQNASSPSTGVIYTHKVITGNNPNQLNIIPTISHTNSIPGRAPVVKFNIIRPVNRQQMTGAIQAVLQTPRLQQQQQQQQQQTVKTENLIGSPIEVNNQVSSTTLEQLREFESVLEQVKERSIQPQAHHSISNSATTTTVQTQTTTQQTQANKPQQQQQQQLSVSALAQQLMMPTQPNATSETFASNGNTVTFQQESVFSQKIPVAYVKPSNSSQVVTAKVAANSTPTPVVVVTSYCQPAASPTLSVTSQSSSSPCVTPAPAPSAGKTPPTPPSTAAAAAAAAAKTGVKKSTPKTVKTSATNTSKASPIPKPQQKPQEDEQTAQRIYAILDEYAEQLRNSPDLNNKPAPRRRSNPPTNPSQSSKRKKSSSSKTKPVGQQTSELSPSTDDLGRTMGSEDSSSGVVHVQDSPAGFSAPEEPVNVNASSHVSAEASTEVRALTSDSNDGVELNVKRRNLIFTEPGSGQPRTVIVQEAIPNSVSVSEAIASVTSKIGNASVLMPSIVLPLVAKGTQYTIVSGSKLLATVPTTVRASSNANTLVLQSFINQGTKLITQPHVKQMKMQPTLQTLSNNNQTLTSAQNVQSASVVIPQTASAQFVGETATATVTTPDVKPNVIGDLTLKNETAVAVGSGIAVESAATNAAIVVNKSNNPTISLIGTRTINEISDSQQICGVITSNPTLQSTTRLFNSSIHKLSAPALKTDNVVCIASAAAAVSHPPDKKSSQDGRDIHAEKPVSIQPGATIALTFASQTDVNAILNDASQQQQKETKEMSTEITSGTKIISPKKRKFNDVIGIQENISPRTLIPMNIATSLQNNTKIESSITSTNKQSSIIDSTTQFLVTGGPSSSDSQESSMQQSAETIDGSCKVGNGLLYENARLQEAWESEGKISPDTPWRYVPTSMQNTLSNDSLKGYSRDSDNSESVLQIINKGQGIEMASGPIYQSNTKKYFMNHTLDTTTSYSNKSNLMKSQLIPRLDRELMQHRIERKAAYERELKLQKSLSEECEDLGVDEPSTSDLFPEADLLFDTNHSPSFDHSSQDASCSQSLGMKPYNSSYFRSLDSSSGSRDASPTSDFKSNECKRSQRARTLKDSLKKSKREKEDLQLEAPVKHLRLTLDNLSQDEASNSNSDISRLSPANLGSLENDSSKDMSGHHRVKLISRSGSKEGTPSSVSSIPSNMKLDIDLDSESLPPSINVNNTSAASSGDESLTLLSNTVDHHTIPSPLSPLGAAGPLLSTHKYTYANKKRVPSSKMHMDSYMAWESPMSERTRSSSEDEDSSISESISSQPEDNVALSNGLEDNVQTLKSLSTDRRCTYVKKKDKLQVNARVVLNRADHKATSTTMAALPKRIPKAESIAVTESMVMSSDKASEASEDEAGNIVLMEPTDCRARRSSLRGHVKKGCACCNGSPERPKKKTTTVKSTDHKLKKRLSSKQPGKRR
ncbi:hypothetical protein EAG_10024 [Camponotus floridanus]|uniref:Uncharacterized protein n=1 Tax=Camponotus floridanus TaxID=104421 RepID=E1ZY71_CAMFO|nr:hypothetical protein EAG_10024 [Camponotus floridanus]